MRFLTLLIVLIAGFAGAPVASAESSTTSPNALAGLYPPAASVHPEAGVAPPRLSGDMWILAEGTHFLYDDFVQVGGSRLVFQRDGNLVLYDELGRAVWASGTDHRGQEGIFQHDGNLVVYVSRGRPFASRTCCHPDLELAVHSAHHLRIYNLTTGFGLWAT